MNKRFRETNHRIDPVKDLGRLGIMTQGDPVLAWWTFTPAT